AERPPAERIQLDQQDVRRQGGERLEQNAAATVAPGVIDGAAIGIDDAGEAAVAGARRRQLDQVGAAQVQPRHGLAAGDESDGKSCAIERVGDGGGAAQMPDAQEVLHMEEDARAAHAPSSDAAAWRSRWFNATMRTPLRSTANR